MGHKNIRHYRSLFRNNAQEHYKMYKDGKNWVYAGIAMFGGLMGALGGVTTSAKAASSTTSSNSSSDASNASKEVTSKVLANQQSTSIPATSTTDSSASTKSTASSTTSSSASSTSKSSALKTSASSASSDSTKTSKAKATSSAATSSSASSSSSSSAKSASSSAKSSSSSSKTSSGAAKSSASKTSSSSAKSSAAKSSSTQTSSSSASSALKSSATSQSSSSNKNPQSDLSSYLNSGESAGVNGNALTVSRDDSTSPRTSLINAISSYGTDNGVVAKFTNDKSSAASDADSAQAADNATSAISASSDATKTATTSSASSKAASSAASSTSNASSSAESSATTSSSASSSAESNATNSSSASSSAESNATTSSSASSSAESSAATPSSSSSATSSSAVKPGSSSSDSSAASKPKSDAKSSSATDQTAKKTTSKSKTKSKAKAAGGSVTVTANVSDGTQFTYTVNGGKAQNGTYGQAITGLNVGDRLTVIPSKDTANKNINSAPAAQTVVVGSDNQTVNAWYTSNDPAIDKTGWSQVENGGLGYLYVNNSTGKINSNSTIKVVWNAPYSDPNTYVRYFLSYTSNGSTFTMLASDLNKSTLTFKGSDFFKFADTINKNSINGYIYITPSKSNTFNPSSLGSSLGIKMSDLISDSQINVHYVDVQNDWDGTFDPDDYANAPELTGDNFTTSGNASDTLTIPGIPEYYIQVGGQGATVFVDGETGDYYIYLIHDIETVHIDTTETITYTDENGNEVSKTVTNGTTWTGQVDLTTGDHTTTGSDLAAAGLVAEDGTTTTGVYTADTPYPEVTSPDVPGYVLVDPSQKVIAEGDSTSTTVPTDKNINVKYEKDPNSSSESGSDSTSQSQSDSDSTSQSQSDSQSTSQSQSDSDSTSQSQS
ncbi:KxYKxGKxW signal peptide domain-containing protein, partial [Levilactobacillus bambusae]|uniref:KxYKxGKxW signal peptide domain-containing protein n=1 Tax=Levilactobacillus bambusae TaxID=2024736 RepID=UPI001402E316